MESIPEKQRRREAYRALVEDLECIRLREIAALSEEEALRQLAVLACAETPWREQREWSGLVEQQALFQRSRK
jgi:hypothetical protein